MFFKWLKGLFKPMDRRDFMRRIYDNEMCKKCVNCLEDDCVASKVPNKKGECDEFCKEW